MKKIESLILNNFIHKEAEKIIDFLREYKLFDAIDQEIEEIIEDQPYGTEIKKFKEISSKSFLKLQKDQSYENLNKIA